MSEEEKNKNFDPNFPLTSGQAYHAATHEESLKEWNAHKARLQAKGWTMLDIITHCAANLVIALNDLRKLAMQEGGQAIIYYNNVILKVVTGVGSAIILPTDKPGNEINDIVDRMESRKSKPSHKPKAPENGGDW